MGVKTKSTTLAYDILTRQMRNVFHPHRSCLLNERMRLAFRIAERHCISRLMSHIEQLLAFLYWLPTVPDFILSPEPEVYKGMTHVLFKSSARASHSMTRFLRRALNALLILCLTSPINAFPKLQNLTTATETHPICTGAMSWTSKSYDPNDCLKSLEKLEDTDLRIFRSRDFEFLAMGATGQTKYDNVRLPRKYTVETCTLIIAMLSDFSDYSLPGQIRVRKEYEHNEVSRFSYLWSVAAWVDRHCVDGKDPRLGWCATGEKFNIGVFFVATKSKFNKEVSMRLARGNASQNTSRSSEL